MKWVSAVLLMHAITCVHASSFARTSYHDQEQAHRSGLFHGLIRAVYYLLHVILFFGIYIGSAIIINHDVKNLQYEILIWLSLFAIPLGYFYIFIYSGAVEKEFPAERAFLWFWRFAALAVLLFLLGYLAHPSASFLDL